jgi:hypothetical protein
MDRATLDTFQAWQELIGAGLSLFVGGVAIWISLRSLRVGREQAQAARDQLVHAQAANAALALARERAVRAALAPVLSGCCEWAALIVASLKALPPGPRLTPAIRDAFKVERLPQQLVDALVRSVENVRDENVIARSARLIGNAQIAYARLTLINDPRMSITGSDVDRGFMDALVVYAQASSLFDYARLKADGVAAALSWDSVGNAIDSLGLHGPGFSGLTERFATLRSVGADPEEL